MGISASHATEFRLWHWRAETPTPDPPLKVTFSTWCGWDTTICGEHSSADFWLHCKAGRGNLHPGVTQWLLAGEISAQGTEMRRWEAPQENGDRRNNLTPVCISLSSFNPSYFANCSQQHPSPKPFPQSIRWYFGMLQNHQRGLFLKQAHAPTTAPDTHHKLGMPDPPSSPKPCTMMEVTFTDSQSSFLHLAKM